MRATTIGTPVLKTVPHTEDAARTRTVPAHGEGPVLDVLTSIVSAWVQSGWDSASGMRTYRTEQLHALTAGDVMSRAAVVLPQGMTVTAAARLLLEEQVRAAPVVDAAGQCVGVLSAADLLRWAVDMGRADEQEGQAATVWCDWQVVDARVPERGKVLRYMTRDPILVPPSTRLAAIASGLLGPQRRPVVVVDEGRQPVGMVSRMDLLAAAAFRGSQPAEALSPARPGDRRTPLRRAVRPLSTA